MNSRSTPLFKAARAKPSLDRGLLLRYCCSRRGLSFIVISLAVTNLVLLSTLCIVSVNNLRLGSEGDAYRLRAADTITVSKHVARLHDTEDQVFQLQESADELLSEEIDIYPRDEIDDRPSNLTASLVGRSLDGDGDDDAVDFDNENVPEANLEGEILMPLPWMRFSL